MAKSFKDSLPGELIHHVTAICGRDGEEWIDGLERTVRELEEMWSVKVLEPFAAGEFNYVAPASRDGEMTVVKIGPPYETTEIFGEADWLRQRDGHGAVNLLAEDGTRRAILIEHAFPGKNLAEIFGEDEASALGPAIDILSTNRIAAHRAPTDAIKLDDWFDGLRRFPGHDLSAELCREGS
jgi:streptomycin 6-kinase